ncbi:MAG: TetR/AcrR family transcriptional regulator C-terminal domain-containing protein [Marmoricola sp.]
MARPTTPLLDRKRIATAAMALLDETGKFTVPDLARKLGVAPSSLYHHVDGRAGVIAGIRDLLHSEIDSEEFEHADWETACALWARSYRAVFARHPGCVQFLAVEPIADELLHAMYDRMAGALIKARFPPGHVLAAITAIESFILGSVLDLAAPGLMFESTNRERTPHLVHALDACPTGPERAELAFEVGLKAILTGLAELEPEHDSEAVATA